MSYANDEQLIRQLEWQNGLYLGIITGLLSAIQLSIDDDETALIVADVRNRMASPLPSHLMTEMKINIDVAMPEFKEASVPK